VKKSPEELEEGIGYGIVLTGHDWGNSNGDEFKKGSGETEAPAESD
jgi:hypothetical protein